jgi:hypothetical protein
MPPRMLFRPSVLLVAAFLFTTSAALAAEEAPPVSYDALLRLDKLPLLADWPAYQDSSYSRKDDNHDEGNFLRIEKNGEQVMVDTDGPGVIYRIWSTGVVGRQMSDKCRFLFYFDGEEKPRLDLSAPELFGAKGSKYPFVPPLSVTFESGAAGNPGEGPANLCYVPIPFKKHIKITGREIAFYHVNYHKLPADAVPESWTPEWARAQKDKHEKASKLFEAVGDEPSPDGYSKLLKDQGVIEPGKTIAIGVDGPALIKSLRVQLAEPASKKLRGVLLRITFDDGKGPSVLAPLGDFFGTGAGDRRFKTLLCGMTDDAYYSYWPMPFAKKAMVEIVNDTSEKVKINRFEVGYDGCTGLPSNMGFFHARYVQNPDCALGKEYTILDVKSHRGKYVGVNITMQNARGAQGIFFLEGDEKIYCDGEKWPSRWLGTGTEDYYNGSYFWNHPDKAGMVRPLGGPTFLDWGIGRVCAYRWHATDWVSFKDSIRVDQEHGGTNEIPTNYQSVAYYYLDAPTAQPALPTLHDRLLKATLPPAPENRGCTLKGAPALADKPLSKRKFHEIDEEIETGEAGHFFAAAKSGDAVEATVEVFGEDEYRVVLYLSGGPEYDAVEVSFDGKKAGTVQAYRAGPRALHPWIELPVTKMRLNGGEHKLQLKAKAEKHEDGIAHIGLVALHLRPTSPLVGVWSTIGTWPCPKDGGWKVVNPPEKEQDLTATYEVPGRGKLSWKKVDATTVYFAGDWSVAYGLTYVWSPDERTVGCFLGRDDSLKVWVNDDVVFDVWGFSHLIPDSGSCAVKLKKGWNKVLVKNGNWGGAFGYCVRFGDPERELKYARQPD